MPLVAAVTACTAPAPEAREEVLPAGSEAIADLPMPEEPVELLTPEIRRACASVVNFWGTDPAAAVRTLDSTVTRPLDGRTTDACWVLVRLEEDRQDDDPRVPFAAAGWLPLPEFNMDASAGQRRVWQLDPVRCLVLERWDVRSPADTTTILTPWFEQAVACFRRQ